MRMSHGLRHLPPSCLLAARIDPARRRQSCAKHRRRRPPRPRRTRADVTHAAIAAYRHRTRPTAIANVAHDRHQPSSFASGAQHDVTPANHAVCSTADDRPSLQERLRRLAAYLQSADPRRRRRHRHQRRQHDAGIRAHLRLAEANAVPLVT